MSVLILTKDEERNISACVGSVPFAAEVVVLDSGSTDRTVEIASSCGAAVHSRAMTNFADQRNHATLLASSDWVLHLDADERVTPELWDEIQKRIETPDTSAFRIPTLNHILGAPLRHGGWYPNYHVRLYRPADGQWSGSVHEALITKGRVGTFEQPILHFGHPDVATFVRKIDRYTTIEAISEDRSVAVLALLAGLSPIPLFLHRYVLKRGLLDGWRGLAAALLLAFYRSLTYLKAIERKTIRPETPSS